MFPFIRSFILITCLFICFSFVSRAEFLASISGVVNTTCAGSTGTAHVDVTGSTGAVTYVWSTVPPQLTATATGLSAGNYRVTVSDATGVKDTLEVNIGITGGMTNSVTRTFTSCSRNDATATINTVGASGTLYYLWSPSVSTSASATGLSPGNYSVTVIDSLSAGLFIDTLFYDNFDAGTASWQLNRISGLEDPDANIWLADDLESWDGVCGSGNLVTPGDFTLHIGCSGPFCLFSGAAYDAGGGFTNTTTDRCTIMSVDANTVGRTNVTVSFAWRCQGQPGQDYGLLRYSPDGGATWTDLPTRYEASTQWTCASVILPASCWGVTNLRVGFRWINDNDGAGTDPAFAIDDFRITANRTGAAGSACRSVLRFPVYPPLAYSLKTNVTCFAGNNGTASVYYEGSHGRNSYRWVPAVSTTSSATGLIAGTYTAHIYDTIGSFSSSTDTLFSDNFDGAALWTLNTSSGTNGAGANRWIIDDFESWNGVCGSGNLVTAGDKTLHVYCTGALCGILGTGAIYNAGPGGNNTDKFSSTTASISTIGYSGARVTFGWRCFGENNADYALFRYSTDGGGTWTDLPTKYQTQTTWQCANIVLPAACNGIANLKLGFRWINDDNGVGTDPCMAIDDVKLFANTSSASGSVCHDSVIINITQPADFAYVRNTTPDACGTSNGTAGVLVSGGTGPYTYSWNTTPTQTTAIASGLSAGNYVVTVTDSLGCTDTARITVPVGTSSVTAGILTFRTSCATTTDGRARIVAPPGSYSYAWSSPIVSLVDSATGLAPGSYSVTVSLTASPACDTVINFTILSAAPLAANATTTPDFCSAGMGTATAVVSGRAGSSFTYSWNTVPVQNTATATSLLAGTYIVTVTDSLGCSDTALAVVNSSAGGIPASIRVNPITCVGANNGSATVTVGAGSYTYTWSPAVSVSNTANSLNPGTYSVTVALSASPTCDTFFTFTLTDPAPLVADALVTPDICGFGNGSATATTLGGLGNYTYSWNTAPVQITRTASNLIAGSYIVTVTDSLGCSDTALAVVPAGVRDINARVVTRNASCPGINNGFARIITSEPGALIYTWSPAVSSIDSSNTLPAGTYTVVVSSAGAPACDTTLTFTIRNIDSVRMTTSVTPDYCLMNSGTATANAAGGVGPYTYIWSTVPTQFGSIIDSLSTGSYSVVAIDSRGCTVSNVLSIVSSLMMPISAGPDTSIIHDQPVWLNASSPIMIDSLLWSTGSTDNSISVAPSQTSVYYVCASSGICSGCDTVVVFVKEQDLAIMPTGFSPNGDGVNDVFRVLGNHIQSIKLQIYNRWGEKVFETTNRTQGWDGNFKGRECELGVYVWYLDAIFDNGGRIQKAGEVTLLR